MKRFGIFLIGSQLCLHSLGCATYHLGHYKRALPGGYDRIAIPMFQNKTPEVGIETYFTNALRTEFERSGLAQVTSKNDAQVVLEGSVSTLSIVGGNPTDRDDAGGIQTPNIPPNPYSGAPSNPLPKGTTLSRDYTSNVLVKVVARKVSDNSVLWEGNFTSQRTYPAALIGTPSLTYANPLYNQNSKMNTIQSQAQDLMAEAHDRLTENF